MPQNLLRHVVHGVTCSHDLVLHDWQWTWYLSPVDFLHGWLRHGDGCHKFSRHRTAGMLVLQPSDWTVRNSPGSPTTDWYPWEVSFSLFELSSILCSVSYSTKHQYQCQSQPESLWEKCWKSKKVFDHPQLLPGNIEIPEASKGLAYWRAFDDFQIEKSNGTAFASHPVGLRLAIEQGVLVPVGCQLLFVKLLSLPLLRIQRMRTGWGSGPGWPKDWAQRLVVSAHATRLRLRSHWALGLSHG